MCIFVFSVYDSDRNGFAVFDMRLCKTAYLNDSLATPVAQWYFQGGKYFSIDEEADDEADEESESFDSILGEKRSRPEETCLVSYCALYCLVWSNKQLYPSG